VLVLVAPALVGATYPSIGEPDIVVVLAPLALLEAIAPCRPGRLLVARRELTAFDRDPLRRARFVVGLCTKTGGSSFEWAAVGGVSPAGCAKLFALQVFKAITPTVPRHKSLCHSFKTSTNISPAYSD
jgi:hypothetical protein